MSPKRIVLTGGTGSGKTSLIKELNTRKFNTTEEESREIIQKESMEFYVNNPELFFPQVFEKYISNYMMAEKYEKCFYDRGFPDILAMIDLLPHLGYKKKLSNKIISEARELSEKNKYDKVFLLQLLPNYNPKEHLDITPDQRQVFHKKIKFRYGQLGYDLVKLPFYVSDKEKSIDMRINKILREIK